MASPPRWFIAALACGVAFAVDGVLEYGQKLGAGLGPAANGLYMYVFSSPAYTSCMRWSAWRCSAS